MSFHNTDFRTRYKGTDKRAKCKIKNLSFSVNGYGYSCNHVTFLFYRKEFYCCNYIIISILYNITTNCLPLRGYGYSCNHVTISMVLEGIILGLIGAKP